MCLILFAWDVHPEYKLILAANRDEFYKRPTQSAHFWNDTSGILAGKDLQAGGTWMGINKNGKFGAVTNYRDLSRKKPVDARSRGDLVTHFLKSQDSPQDYLLQVHQNSDLFDGFNLLVGDQNRLFYYSNIERKITELTSGIYGLSNSLLDVPWPKVKIGKALLADTLQKSGFEDAHILNILYNVDHAEDNDLPDTGVGIDFERKLSPLFIKMDDYGTRSSTLLKISRENEYFFWERTFDQGEIKSEVKEKLKVNL